MDTAGKARFVATEFKTRSTEEYNAHATTVATNCLIDVVATRRKHSRLATDISRAVHRLEEDELVLVDPPKMWKEAEAAAGRASTRSWRIRSVLYGSRKAPREWLELFGTVLEEPAGLVRSKTAPHFFRSPNGQVVAQLHMDDVHASGPDDDLEKLEGDVSARVTVRQAVIFRVGPSATVERLRRERILTLEGCCVRANSTYVERAASLLGLENCTPVSPSLRASDWND